METCKSLVAIFCLSLTASDAFAQAISEVDRANLVRLHLALNREEKPSVVYSRTLELDPKQGLYEARSSTTLFNRDKHGTILSLQIINHPDYFTTKIAWIDSKSETVFASTGEETIKVNLSAFSKVRMPGIGMSFGSYIRTMREIGDEKWKAADFEAKSTAQPFCGGGFAAQSYPFKPNRLPSSLTSAATLLGGEAPKRATVWISASGTPIICRMDVEFASGRRDITTFEYGAMEVPLPRNARSLSKLEIAEMQREAEE